jgi:dihydroorotase
MSSLLIKNVNIVDPNSEFNNSKKDILLKNGLIEKIEDNIEVNNLETVQEDNLHVCPGLFDFSVDFPEPGNEQRETLKSGVFSSKSGGFTGLGLQPTYQPTRDKKSEILFCKNTTKDFGIDVVPFGAISKELKGEQLAEMFDMYKAGALAFSDNMRPVHNSGLFSRALLYAKNFNGLIISFPYEEKISPNGLVNEGVISTKLGLEGISDLSEELMVNRDLLINKYHEGRLHFNILSSKKSLEQLEVAKKTQNNLSCGTSIFHLLFDDEIINQFDNRFKILPPFRTKEDRNALLEGVKNGTIDVITSYHQPYEKETTNVEFSLSPFGKIGTQVCFPLALTYLKEYIGLEKIVQCMSINPRTILQLEVPIIKEGYRVNMTLFNPDKKWTYDKNNNTSMSENTGLFGAELNGFVHGTIHESNYHKNLLK